MGQVYIPGPSMQMSPINRRTKLARSELELIERLTRSDRLVYSPHMLAELFRAMRERKIYAQQTSYEDFLEFVLKRGHLTQIALHAPHYDETILRFCSGSLRRIVCSWRRVYRRPRRCTWDQTLISTVAQESNKASLALQCDLIKAIRNLTSAVRARLVTSSNIGPIAPTSIHRQARFGTAQLTAPQLVPV